MLRKISFLLAGIVAYSPLGRGFLSKGPSMTQNFAKEDTRENLPRCQPENVEHNKFIFERVSEMASKKGCTPARLVLAWVHHQGNDVCPILGTTKVENLKQNMETLSIILTPEEMPDLEAVASADSVKGDRYRPNQLLGRILRLLPLSSWKYGHVSYKLAFM